MLTCENSSAALSTNSRSDQTAERGPISRLSSAPTTMAIKYDGMGTFWDIEKVIININAYFIH